MLDFKISFAIVILTFVLFVAGIGMENAYGQIPPGMDTQKGRC
jgi:hypothetical protein